MRKKFKTWAGCIIIIPAHWSNYPVQPQKLLVKNNVHLKKEPVRWGDMDLNHLTYHKFCKELSTSKPDKMFRNFETAQKLLNVLQMWLCACMFIWMNVMLLNFENSFLDSREAIIDGNLNQWIIMIRLIELRFHFSIDCFSLKHNP